LSLERKGGGGATRVIVIVIQKGIVVIKASVKNHRQIIRKKKRVGCPVKEKRGEGGKLKGRIQWEGRKSETREYGLEECKTKGLKQFQISSGVAKKKKKRFGRVLYIATSKPERTT